MIRNRIGRKTTKTNDMQETMNGIGRTAGKFFLNRRNIFILGFILTFVVTLLEVSRGKQFNFFTFQLSTFDFWQGADPYGVEKYDFLYGPLFSILFTPFAYLGATVGPFVWNLMNFSLYFCAIFAMPHLTEAQKCKTYLFTALILATTQMSMQFNPVVAYLFLFAFVLLEKGRPTWAILLILISGFTKIYGIFELGLLLCYPRFWRNLLVTIAMAIALLLLPAVSLGFDGLLPHYLRWAEVLSLHVDQFQFYSLFNLYPVHDLLTPVMTYVQMGSIIALCLLFVANYRQFGRYDFRVGSLAVLMGWVILFSLSTEKHTYVIALTGYLMWYWAQANRGWLDKTLFWANFLLLVVVPVDLICPPPVMRFLCDTVQLNIYCFAFTWFRMIYVTFLKPVRETELPLRTA